VEVVVVGLAVVGLAAVGLAAVEWKKELTQKKKDLRSP
jgi:hypothetical protein